eukprot:tig00021244_g19580.t1
MARFEARMSTEEELVAHLNEPGLKVVEAYSSWCGPCRATVQALKSVFYELEAGPRLEFLVADSKLVRQVREEPALAASARPTFLFFRSRALLDAVHGVDMPLLRRLCGAYLPRGEEKGVPAPTPEARHRLICAPASSPSLAMEPIGRGA